jgi:2-keto-4-pentenoate hydratase/2-oxohepta-3-ene-1,7-dioic acid hydratase in catechol pathway
MNLVSFSTGDGRIQAGSLEPLAQCGPGRERRVSSFSPNGEITALAVIASGRTAANDRSGEQTAPVYPLSEVRLHAPLLNPPRIFAIGLNYRDHAIEAKLELPEVPVVFFKLQTAIIGRSEERRVGKEC